MEALRRSARLALFADRASQPVLEYAEETFDAWKLTRRDFLGRMAAAAGALILSGGARTVMAEDSPMGRGPTVAVVGAGIAGLTCAWRLQQQGIPVTLYEGSTRVGGRMLTVRKRFEDDQIAELGGELIDSNHRTMHDLARELDIQLDDLFADEPRQFLRDVFVIDGRIVSEHDILTSFGPVARRIQADLAASKASDEAYARFDQMTMAEYLESIPESAGLIRSLLRTAYTGECGLEPEAMSSLLLIDFIDAESTDAFRIFGDSDERFHTHDGNDTFTTRLSEKLTGHLELGHRLVGIRPRPDGRLGLAFESEGGAIEKDFDQVVVAIPFTLLRRVGIQVELPPEKSRAIGQLAYGTNAKLMAQFSSRVWRDRYRMSGSTITNNDLQTLWDTSRGQKGKSGLMTNFLGGRIGLASESGTPEGRFSQSLPHIEAIYPGVTEAYRKGSAIRMHWPSAPWVRGSYSTYGPGQLALAEAIRQPVGNLHFCGEHCSEDFQGFMEGAAETGTAVAKAILAGVRR